MQSKLQENEITNKNLHNEVEVLKSKLEDIKEFV